MMLIARGSIPSANAAWLREPLPGVRARVMAPVEKGQECPHFEHMPPAHSGDDRATDPQRFLCPHVQVTSSQACEPLSSEKVSHADIALWLLSLGLLGPPTTMPVGLSCSPGWKPPSRTRGDTLLNR